MDHTEATRLVDDLARRVPARTAPTAAVLAAGRGARRRRRRRTTAGVAALIAIAVAAPTAWMLGVSGDSRDGTDETATSTQAPTPPATLYYAQQDARPDGTVTGWTYLVPEVVRVADTGDPAYDALHALFTRAPRDRDHTAGLSFTDVASVEHQDGVVTVDLTRDPWDPYPTADIFGPPGELMTQQIVWTVQAVLRTRDPVAITVEGEPVRGIFLARIDGPVDADPLVYFDQSDGSAGATPVMWVESSAPGEELDVSYDRPWTRGLAYSLTAAGDSEPAYTLLLDRGGQGPSWYPADASVGLDDIGILGVGPDRLVLPDELEPGSWQLCTGNASPQVCAELTVR